MAFNAHEYFVDAVIPPPPQHKSWSRVVWILSDSANMFILSNLLFILGCSSARYRRVIALSTAILVYSLLGLASFCASSTLKLLYCFHRWIPTWNHQRILSQKGCHSQVQGTGLLPTLPSCLRQSLRMVEASHYHVSTNNVMFAHLRSLTFQALSQLYCKYSKL